MVDHAQRGGRLRSLLWPGVTTLAMLSLLLGLGTWQIRRLAWKESILAQIAHAEAAPSIPLSAQPGAFAKVLAHGRFSGPVVLYGVDLRDTPAGPMLGAQQIVPLQRGHGTVLVDRGWVPTTSSGDLTGPGNRTPAGEVTVEGYVRPPDRPRLFGVGDDVARRHFFTLDPARIGAAIGLREVAPFSLVAMGPALPGVYPTPAQHLPEPPNNHLAYALTWYGLAVALLAVFVAWTWRKLTT
ncbi:MAG: SURF1 family protein [Pseudomonadota bacterium]|nr:SURF1 family protein [Pseudomonadota bacterium]